MDIFFVLAIIIAIVNSVNKAKQKQGKQQNPNQQHSQNRQYDPNRQYRQNRQKRKMERVFDPETGRFEMRYVEEQEPETEARPDLSSGKRAEQRQRPRPQRRQSGESSRGLGGLMAELKRQYEEELEKQKRAAAAEKKGYQRPKERTLAEGESAMQGVYPLEPQTAPFMGEAVHSVKQTELEEIQPTVWEHSDDDDCMEGSHIRVEDVGDPEYDFDLGNAVSFNREALIQGIILKEILDKPKALRR